MANAIITFSSLKKIFNEQKFNKNKKPKTRERLLKASKIEVNRF